jgi:hypothetical protein
MNYRKVCRMYLQDKLSQGMCMWVLWPKETISYLYDVTRSTMTRGTITRGTMTRAVQTRLMRLRLKWPYIVPLLVYPRLGDGYPGGRVRQIDSVKGQRGAWTRWNWLDMTCTALTQGGSLGFCLTFRLISVLLTFSKTICKIQGQGGGLPDVKVAVLDLW